MTLDEVINLLELGLGQFMDDDISDKNKGLGLSIERCKDIVNYLKELKTLRVKLENNSKELEIYKKARKE